MNDEITQEPLENENSDNPIELETLLQTLRDMRLPLSQEMKVLAMKLEVINHKIEQTKSKIKVADRIYWENKK